ncbi:RNA polymerase ECF family sigma subunit [Chitinophaga skermanii]|uniref:RNA polymerase ECF family sigma subunit n=1 Tax=Chitinophaga skermanii TaxID=331697 RepID=A0A327QNF9_9BACT|nr:RNA polymerase sigma factor [Chitinophaga skermanii]RAJ05192.1 RNA polymerase ECF family sigma subunit [Chitinophaga skermanii]
MLPTEFNHHLLLHTNLLRAYAVKLTGDIEMSKDLYQDTYCKALSHREQFIPGTNMKAWLHTIMYNTFINQLKRKHLYAKYKLFQERLPVAEFDAVDERILHMEVKELAIMINGLPSPFRDCLQKYCKGFTYAEIAQQSGEPIGTIKSRVHVARKLIKAKVSDT